MNSTTLYHKFSSSLRWNGFFFATYEILNASISFTLYHRLSTQDFSLWATTLSSIYLILLWFDWGLSKSVPRYAPVFSRNLQDHKYFVTSLWAIQILLLLPGIPLLIYYLISQSTQLSLLIIALAIFVSEGLVKILRLTYHAHFHNKQFNLFNTTTVILEVSLTLILIFSIQHTNSLLLSILATKLFCSLILALIALYHLSSLYTDKDYKGDQALDLKKAIKDCASHSIIMGGTNILTSLSERNFLIPLFTYTLGQEASNIFKIANDAALIFYRFVIKTIDTTDTALLSHIETMPNRKELLPNAFKNLSTKIATLCIPLLGILVLLLFIDRYNSYNSLVFNLFFIIAFSYMIDALFSAYERVLEVKRKYLLLAFSYAPYVLILICLSLISSFGLVNSILFLHVVRLVQVLVCLYFVRTLYKLQFPFRFALELMALVSPYIVVGCILLYIVSRFLFI